MSAGSYDTLDAFYYVYVYLEAENQDTPLTRKNGIIPLDKRQTL